MSELTTTVQTVRTSSPSHERHTRYWGAFRDLRLEGLKVEWGHRGVFLFGPMRASLLAGTPHEFDTIESYRLANDEMWRRFSTRPPIPISSPRRLDRLCRLVINDLAKIADWEESGFGGLSEPSLIVFATTPFDSQPLLRQLGLLALTLDIQAAPTIPASGASSNDALSWVRSLSAAVAELGPNVVPPTSSECEFKLRGDYWRIRFRKDRTTEEGHFQNDKGFAYLACLLARPYRPLSVEELVGNPIEETVPEELLDMTALRKIKERLEELDCEIESSPFSDPELSSRQEEREQLLKQIRAATGKLGKPRRIRSPKEKASEAVWTALTRAREKIRDTMPKLGLHLNSVRHYRGTFQYLPDSVPDWHL